MEKKLRRCNQEYLSQAKKIPVYVSNRFRSVGEGTDRIKQILLLRIPFHHCASTHTRRQQWTHMPGAVGIPNHGAWGAVRGLVLCSSSLQSWPVDSSGNRKITGPVFNHQAGYSSVFVSTGLLIQRSQVQTLIARLLMLGPLSKTPKTQLLRLLL